MMVAILTLDWVSEVWCVREWGADGGPTEGWDGPQYPEEKRVFIGRHQNSEIVKKSASLVWANSVRIWEIHDASKKG